VLVPIDAAALRRNPDAAEPISEVAGRNNIVVRLPGRGRGRSLILNCHLDTQPAGDPGEWTHPPFSGHIDAASNAIFGRGAMDDKAGVAICLGLMRTLVEQRLRLDGDLVFQFVLEDETTGNGSPGMSGRRPCRRCRLIVDGTRPDRAIDRHAGNMEFHVALKGRPASVSVSHMGANAAEMLSRMLLDLRDAFFRLNDKRRAPWTEFPQPLPAGHVTGLNADAPRFCVPVDASARCFTTLPRRPTRSQACAAFSKRRAPSRAQANGYPHAPVFAWEGFAAEPVSCASPELGALVKEAAGRHGSRTCRIGPSTGTSDMRPLRQTRHTLPSLRPGPKASNPHRADEHFLLDDLPLMMQVYLDMVIEWCSVARA
jgi:acetylornithine deacetylase